ncbi:hypothetical protein [Streptomyces roseoviridis]|uniref:Secreted protein n=1 Tax=Streptomyces roseoviridis TaxID=67361 RepID=A0ABV5QYH3_9ACTN
MDQGVAAVVAAGAAFTAALTGSFVGAWVGRRQVRDQAQVEHDQWLRGQRQEAYLALIVAWDEVIPKFENRVLDVPDIQRIDDEDAWDEAGTMSAERTEGDREPFQRVAERVQMLGPNPVEQAVTAMLRTLDELAVGIAAQYATREEGREPLEEYWRARAEVDRRRARFLDAARDALRRTPDTKRS